ncbi:Os11g0605300, partial [Oryza sativa Japonica Group]
FPVARRHYSSSLSILPDAGPSVGASDERGTTLLPCAIHRPCQSAIRRCSSPVDDEPPPTLPLPVTGPSHHGLRCSRSGHPELGGRGSNHPEFGYSKSHDPSFTSSRSGLEVSGPPSLTPPRVVEVDLPWGEQAPAIPLPPDPR